MKALKKNLRLAGSLVVTLSASPAFANKTVDAPYVDKGDAYLEWKGGYQADHRSDVSGS